MSLSFIPRWDAIGILSLNVTFARSFKTNWTLVGLFDGFGGPETKNFIASPLILRVVDALLGLVPKYETPTPEHTEVGMTPPRNMTLEPYPEAMDKAIRDVFLAMDDEIVHRVPESAMSSSSFVAGIQPLGVALSGASALLSFYDRESRMLKLALTGNSRAVLGRLTENKDGLPVYEVHVLTAEHTLENPAERARIDALYPDQNPFFNPQWQNARRVTRAFGLAMYKWSREVQERVYRDYLGDLPLQDIMMPPHITAEPDITTIDILPGDFLIMGSSGLWNCLTDEEAVGLVGLGLMRNMYALGHGQRPNPANHENSLERWELPVSTLGADNTAMYRLWRADKKFVCLDDNAAAHLARNALGGANSDLADVLLNMTPPRSWKFRFARILNTLEVIRC
jgi:pyruvate dehydrogenase phosphatase